MAFIFLREKTLGGQRKVQQYMIIALLAVLLITAFVLWKGFSESNSPIKGQNAPLRASSAKKVEIDFGVLQDKIFDELETPPSAISMPQQNGRSNPFISF